MIPRSKFCGSRQFVQDNLLQGLGEHRFDHCGIVLCLFTESSSFLPHFVMYTCGFVSVSIFMGCKSKIIYMNLIPVFSIESFEDQESLGDKKCLGNLSLIHFSFSQSTFPIDLSEYWAFYPVLVTEFSGEGY